MYNSCIGLPSIPYYRFAGNLTTTILAEFIENKAKAVLAQMEEEDPSLHFPPIEINCVPLVLGKRGGERGEKVNYAAMVIGMTGVNEGGDDMYGKVRMHNYRPKIISGIQNAIVRAYEFSDEKLQSLIESPRTLRDKSIGPKDVEYLYNHRKLQVSNVQGKPYYTFHADMDRIIDDALMNADDDEADIPNYITVGIEAMGDRPDSPLAYDILLTTEPMSTKIAMSVLFKALVSR